MIRQGSQAGKEKPKKCIVCRDKRWGGPAMMDWKDGLAKVKIAIQYYSPYHNF